MTTAKKLASFLLFSAILFGCGAGAAANQAVANNSQVPVSSGSEESPEIPGLLSDEQTAESTQRADMVPEIMSQPSGSERIVGLQLGAPAPFYGVLLNPEAAAWLEAEPDATQERCQLFVNRRLGEVRAEFRADIQRLRLHIETLSSIHQVELRNRDSQIASLLRINEELRNAGPEWWEQFLYIGGALLVGAGLGIILGLVAN